MIWKGHVSFGLVNGEVIDLMALLKRSVERRGAARAARPRPSPRGRRSA